MPLVEKTDRFGAWDYSLFSIDTPPADLGLCGPVKSYWDSKRKSDALPSWRDLQFSELEPWWGWIAVEDILNVEPYNSRFRLWGTKVTRLLGIELTGKTFNHAVEIGLYVEAERAIWARLATEPLILLANDNIDWVKDYYLEAGKRFYDITLPLADDGYTIDKLFSVTIID